MFWPENDLLRGERDRGKRQLAFAAVTKHPELGGSCRFGFLSKSHHQIQRQIFPGANTTLVPALVARATGWLRNRDQRRMNRR